jgi:hypothetical protein
VPTGVVVSPEPAHLDLPQNVSNYWHFEEVYANLVLTIGAKQMCKPDVV